MLVREKKPREAPVPSSLQPDFFEKCTNIEQEILLYQSSPERKRFVKLKETQLFCLVIELMKPFAVPNTCLFLLCFNYSVIISSKKDDIPIPL